MVASAVSLDLPRLTGRPTKFTPEVTAKIIANVAAGNYYQPSCIAAGVSYDTFRDWMRAGEAGDPIFVGFFQQVQAAEAEAELRLQGVVRDAASIVPKVGLDLLARRHPDRWADQSKRTVTVEGSVQVNHLAVIASTSLPDLYRLLAGAGGLIDHAALPMPTAETESAG